MTEVPIASTKVPRLPPAAALDSFAALKSHRSAMAMGLAYTNVLERTVLPRLGDRKLDRSYRRILDSFDTFPILQFVWRESPFVSDEDLARLCLPRTFQASTMTAHALAVSLSPNSASLGTTIKRVSGIVRASNACGLIDEERVGPKKILIGGSTLLHEMMVAVATEQAEILGVTGNCG